MGNSNEQVRGLLFGTSTAATVAGGIALGSMAIY